MNKVEKETKREKVVPTKKFFINFKERENSMIHANRFTKHINKAKLRTKICTTHNEYVDLWNEHALQLS